MLWETLSITGSVGASCTYSINKDFTIDEEKAKLVGALTATGAASTLAGNLLSCHDSNVLHERYSQSYIESMSDEELASALEQLDLLEAEMTNQEDSKTK